MFRSAIYHLLLMSCLLSVYSSPENTFITTSHTVYIKGLSTCNSPPQKSLHITPNTPLTILVHSYSASAENFTNLSEALTQQGQQSVCFSYNDRDSLLSSAQALRKSISDIALYLPAQELTLLGHSQGGLISRKASTLTFKQEIAVKLVTVSAPLSDIQAAKNCGNPLLKIASLGVHDLT